jgi:hypothetical protein
MFGVGRKIVLGRAEAAHVAQHVVDVVDNRGADGRLPRGDRPVPVREERGRVWAKGAAWVIVSNDAGEIGRALIHLAPEEGVNYVVHVPMDSGTAGAHDTPTALQPTVGFTADADLGWTLRLGSTLTTTSISNCAKLHLQSYSTAEN